MHKHVAIAVQQIPASSEILSFSLPTPTPNLKLNGDGNPSPQFRASVGSIIGGVLGLLLLTAMVGIFVVLVVFVALKFKRQTTETLEPWPTVHR